MPSAYDIDKYLGGYFSLKDFAEDQEMVLTITGLKLEEVGERKDSKPVLSFAETTKKLVMNKTRNKLLKGLFGTSDVVGKQISVTRGVESVNGSDREMVVIRPVD